MHTIAMILRGQVWKSPAISWNYKDNARPLARSLEGFAVCEISLADPGALIDVNPQPAELLFMRVVKFEDAVEQIDLYDGRMLAMHFSPLGVKQSS